MRRILSIAVIFGLALSIWIACAPKQKIDIGKIDMNQSKQQLIERANRLWNAILEGNRKTIDELQSPRAKDSTVKFAGGGQTAVFNILNYSIDAVEIDPDGLHATVIVTNSFIIAPVPKPKVIVGQMTRWEMIDGVWYPEYKEEAPRVSGVRKTK